ncbi:MAG: CPBP family intramembrane glutamic endopeptidase [Dehalobacterium sp.]
MNEKIIQPRWRAWEVIVGIVGVVLTMIAFGYLVELTSTLWKINELFFIFWASFMQTLLMICVSWYIAVVKHGHSFRDLGFIKNGFLPALPKGIKWGVLLFFMVMILGIFQTIFYPAEPELQDFAKILLMVDSYGELFLAVIMGVVLAPIGEEVYFRGFLYPALRQHFGAAKGIIITALFFSCMHFDLYRLIPIAAGGIGLTYLYERSGNIWTNIIAHGVWNAIMIALLIFAFPVA